MARKGTIRRVARGVYDFPRISRRLGQLSPTPDVIAQAVARNTGHQLHVSGPRAANALGLSTQVPARAVYLTDGPTRQLQIGRQTIYLKQARRFGGAGQVSGTVFRALSYLGKDRVDDSVVSKLSRSLSQTNKCALMRDMRYASTWMHNVIHRISQGANC